MGFMIWMNGLAALKSAGDEPRATPTRMATTDAQR
jgi:hypothetical protein